MIVKVYAMLWAVIGLAAAALFITGNFSELTAVIFGFISFGMVFMGMMGVLPATIAHPSATEQIAPNLQPAASMSASTEEENKGLATTAAQVPVH